MNHSLDATVQQDLEDFLIYIQSRSFSTHTKDAYIRDVKGLLEYVGRSADQIKKVDIMRYQKIVRDRGAGDRSINRMLSAVRCFYNALIEFERVEVNPTLTIKKAKVEKNVVPVYLNEEELASFHESISGRHKLRDLTMCLLMGYAGLRVFEIHSLNVEHFVDGSEPYLQFMGKGRKWRTVPLHADIASIIRRYAAERLTVKDEADSTALFVSQKGHRISRRTIQSVVERTVKQVKGKRPELKHKKISSHKLRHTFATSHFRRGTDLRTLQALLGHSDISTTQVYTHVENKQLVEAQARISPNIPRLD
ncbi:tyrosine-type recombinase/integrase [Paenibacillus sp. YYML68]|uniref:tyrosine-type recombinase/integrase n=1 Tax=Paenibacillus sp. YYML68 TaxID=2909250 RepID=UPI0024905273|nr:tyrosine-type recombinase/integrase [Paenibacillus sp. YYML68]